MKILMLLLVFITGCESQAVIEETNRRFFAERQRTIDACIYQGGVPETSAWSNRIVCKWRTP